MKYFRTDLGGSLHAGIQFQIVAIIGCAVGVYATDKPAEIEALSKLAPKVAEITQAEYEDYLKKKAPGSKSLNVLSVPSAHPRQHTISGEGRAVVVEGKTLDKDRPVEIRPSEISTAEEALVVAPVEASPKPAEPEPVATPHRRRGNR